MENLTGYASATLKISKPNQDYCTDVKNEKLNLSGVIVADGIGSHPYSDIASQICSDSLKNLIEEIQTIEELNFKSLFDKVKMNLVKEAKKKGDFVYDSLDKNNSLGTTLICALDCNCHYKIAYVGNGSILYVNGLFNEFGKNFYLPWNSINLLNPHSIEEEGKAKLYRFLSISDLEELHNPTVLSISKDKNSAGEIIIITTDGVVSNDEIPIAKDSNGTLWIRGETTLPLLYDTLSKFLNNNPMESKEEDLKNELSIYLSDLKEKNLMHDDTTLGVIISKNTIDYHQKKYANKEMENNEGITN